MSMLNTGGRLRSRPPAESVRSLFGVVGGLWVGKLGEREFCKVVANFPRSPRLF